MRSGDSPATVSMLGSPRVPMSLGSFLSGTAVSQVLYPLTSATPTGSTPSDIRLSTTFHSVPTTFLVSPSSSTFLPEASVRVMRSPVFFFASSTAGSVVPQAVRVRAAAVATAAVRRRRLMRWR